MRYREWHGPDASVVTAELRASAIADIALLQGVAPDAADVVIELDSGDNSPPRFREVSHFFTHPDRANGQRSYFELTLDHAAASGARRARLHIAGEPIGSWVELPKLPSPGTIVGSEHVGSCPACASTDFRTAGARQHLTMVTCQQCQLVLTSPRPAEEQTLIRYSERYFSDEYLPSQQLTPELLTHIDAVLDHAEPAKPISPHLFELGVGGGNLAQRASERGWTVRGTDVNPASIEHGKERGLDVWVENADHADSLGGTYGAVISEMSLEHVRHPDHFCSLAAEALVPGGRLVIYTVSAEGASFEHAGMASPLVGPAEHLFLYSAGSLVALCESAGLRVDHLWRNYAGDEIGVVATKRRDTRIQRYAPRRNFFNNSRVSRSWATTGVRRAA